MRSIPILNCANNIDFLTSGPYIVCFDNNILYDHFHFGSLSSIGYDNLDLQIKFLHDILVTVINADLKLVYKIKRPGNLNLPCKFLSFLDEMKIKYEDNFIVIESDISPLLLMKSARATICKPLSTTALIANQNSLNVVFYDPSALIRKNDSNLRGIRTLSSVKELKQFVIEIGT